jgi:hypothetical protein
MKVLLYVIAIVIAAFAGYWLVMGPARIIWWISDKLTGNTDGNFRSLRVSKSSGKLKPADVSVPVYPKCPKCGGKRKLGTAIVNQVTGIDDFPGTVSTMSPDPHQPKIIQCLKCEKCGFSVSL